MPDVTCPFCGEADFDLRGLKMHIQRWCDKFAEIDGRTSLEIEKATREQTESGDIPDA